MQEKLFQPLGFFQGFWRYASYEFRTSFKPLCVTYALGFLFLCLLKLDMSFYNSTLENMIYTSLVILCVGFFSRIFGDFGCVGVAELLGGGFW